MASAKIRILEQHGYSPVAYFALPMHCWLDNYYRPMQSRFEAFPEQHGHSAQAEAILAAERHEIDLYEKYRSYLSYGFIWRKTARRSSLRLAILACASAVDYPGDRHYFISMKIEIVAIQLESLGSSTRLRVYRTLVRAGDAGLPVGSLQEKLGIAASTLSHHLHRLILTELVTQERQGTTLICRANYPAMNSLVGFLVDECCIDEPRCLDRRRTAQGRTATTRTARDGESAA